MNHNKHRVAKLLCITAGLLTSGATTANGTNPTVLETIVDALDITSVITSGEVDLTTLGASVELIEKTNITEQHPQTDGSIAFLIHTNQFIGIRIDNAFAYATPTSKNIVAIETFTKIEPHHCQAFLTVLSDKLTHEGLTVELGGKGGAVSAKSPNGDIITFAECTESSNGSQFVIAAYHMPTKTILTAESNKLITTYD